MGLSPSTELKIQKVMELDEYKAAIGFFDREPEDTEIGELVEEFTNPLLPVMLGFKFAEKEGEAPMVVIGIIIGLIIAKTKMEQQ